MSDIEFKSTFDKIEFDISMKMYMEHNDKIASINEYLNDIYSYKDLEEAEALETYDTLQEYEKALKEKCDAIDKAIEYIEKSMNAPQPFYKYIFADENGDVQNLDKLLDILRGEDNE